MGHGTNELENTRKEVDVNKYPIAECTNCGNDEFYVKQRVSGLIRYNSKLDGNEDAYNGDYIDYLNYKTISKYAYCNNCDKRLFKLTDDMRI